MLIQGPGGAINHRPRPFLRLYSDSPLKLGQDRGVPRKNFSFVSFLKFLTTDDASSQLFRPLLDGVVDF